MTTANLKSQVQLRIDALTYPIAASELLQNAVDTVGLGLDLTNIISVLDSATTAITGATPDDDVTALNAASVALGVTSKSIASVPVGGVVYMSPFMISDYTSASGERLLRSGEIEKDVNKFNDSIVNPKLDELVTSVNDPTTDMLRMVRLSDGRYIASAVNSGNGYGLLYTNLGQASGDFFKDMNASFSVTYAMDRNEGGAKDTVVLATNSGMCTTIDNGDNWVGITQAGDFRSCCYLPTADKFYALTSAGVLFSSVDGVNWVSDGAVNVTSPFNSTLKYGVNSSGQEVILLANDSDFYASLPASPTSFSALGCGISDATAAGGELSNLLILKDSELRYSLDCGDTWEIKPISVSSALSERGVLVREDGFIYIGAGASGSYQSFDFGDSFYVDPVVSRVYSKRYDESIINRGDDTTNSLNSLSAYKFAGIMEETRDSSGNLVAYSRIS